MKKYFLIAIVVLSTFTANLFAQKTNTNADAIVGTWLTTNGKGKVKIEKYGEKYMGKLIWLKEPISPTTGKAKLDAKNADDKLKTRQLFGITNLLGFVYKGRNIWEDGTIYDPENGKTYSCNMNLKSENILEVHGYIGFSLIGRDVEWTRVVEPSK